MALIVVVTKDIAEFMIYQPVVARLRAAGHEVSIAAEGLSLQKWLEAGEQVINGAPDPDKVDSQTLYRFDMNPGKILFSILPDMVLTGLSAPTNNLGEQFGLAASGMGITLGYVTDVWGAESRSRAVPDFICTLDSFGRKRIEVWGPYQARMPHIHVTGSPAMDGLRAVKDKGAEMGICDMIQGRGVFTCLLAGQDESTTPVIEGLIQALNMVDNGNYVLIPRLHPKFMKQDEFCTPWFKALTKAKGEVLWVGPRVTTQELIGEVDVVVSVYSNALIEAAALGSVPVSWVSDIGRQKMRENLGGLERFPLVSLACCIEVGSPEEFLLRACADSREATDVLKRCGEVFPCDGKNTERVVAAIESELV